MQQQTLIVFRSSSVSLTSWRHNINSLTNLRAFSSSPKFNSSKKIEAFSANNHLRSRGVLPRFHSPTLPSLKGEVVKIEGDEFWHMVKVLRLGVSDRVELFNGAGGITEGCISTIDRNGANVIALEDQKLIALYGTQWHVYAAFGTLKGGRADWLIEKCTELGACGVTPLLTARSCTIADNRMDRFERVILAATKQCQRLHGMTLHPPMKFDNFLTIVAQSKISLLAAAEAMPVIDILKSSSIESNGIMIVGPEGDFTEEEVELMTKAGATPVGLGPCRLRVETATISLLSTLMMWFDSWKSNSYPHVIWRWRDLQLKRLELKFTLYQKLNVIQQI